MKDFDILISECIGSFDCPCATPLASNKIISLVDRSSRLRYRVVIRSVECLDFISDYQLRYKRYPDVYHLLNNFVFEVLISQPSLFE